jgi:hypothetical protein
MASPNGKTAGRGEAEADTGIMGIMPRTDRDGDDDMHLYL